MKPDASSEQPSAAANLPRVSVHGRTFELFIHRTAIADAIEHMAESITRDYAGKELVLVVVLKGSVFFAADLARAIALPIQLEFVRASSYGASMQSSGQVILDGGGGGGKLDAVAGRDVLIVEDIADSGTTIAAIMAQVEQHKPRTVAVATLLSKPAVHQGRIPLQYVGIEIEPVFVIGYGLDYNELGRNLPDIYRLVE